MRRAALILTLLYAAYAVVMIRAHPVFLYPFQQDAQLVPGFTRQMLPGGGSVQVSGGEGPTVLYFMGNIGALSYFRCALDGHRAAGRSVVALEYPGGGGRPGRPSEARLKADALEALDLAQGMGAPVYAHGYSLGTGLALHVAAQRDIAGVVLDAPYGRICTLMSQASGLPACLLPGVDRWDSLAAATAVTEPVLVRHGLRDRIISVEEGRRLDASLADVTRVEFERLGHASISCDPAAVGAMQDWFAQMENGRGQ